MILSRAKGNNQVVNAWVTQNSIKLDLYLN